MFTKSIWEFLKLAKLGKKIPETCKNVLLQNCFLNVNRKGIYVIWVRLKVRKLELKQ